MRQIEDGETIWKILLGPPGELWGVDSPGIEGLFKEAFGLGAIRRIEDRPDALRYAFALIEAGDIRLRVLLLNGTGSAAKARWARQPGARP
jgi:hypothetical protein